MSIVAPNAAMFFAPSIPNLVPFLTESVRIGLVTRPPLQNEVKATEEFILLDEITADDVEKLARVYKGEKAVLRSKKGLNGGGPAVIQELKDLLRRINAGKVSPWRGHGEFMALRPLLDGNGLVGRTIWAWQHCHMLDGLPAAGFLVTWYGETLANVAK